MSKKKRSPSQQVVVKAEHEYFLAHYGPSSQEMPKLTIVEQFKKDFLEAHYAQQALPFEHNSEAHEDESVYDSQGRKISDRD